MTDGKYSVLLAHDVDRGESIVFLAFNESYVLDTVGVYGTIPDFYVRLAYQ